MVLFVFVLKITLFKYLLPIVLDFLLVSLIMEGVLSSFRLVKPKERIAKKRD